MTGGSDQRRLDADSLLGDILDVEAGRTLISGALPGLAASPLVMQLRSLPLARVLEVEAARGGGLDPSASARLFEQLGEIAGAPEPAIVPVVAPPRDDYQPDSVPAGSAAVTLPHEVGVWQTVEVALSGPDHGNPFTDVELTAQLRSPDGRALEVGGFYDGDGEYRLRFLPDLAGDWSLRTTSNARSLDGIEATVKVGPAGPTARGPVRVADRFHFAYADGSRYTPVGTTAYAWTHQPPELQEQTLATLAASPFNKLRMCVFPKSYLFNANEPPCYPFAPARDASGPGADAHDGGHGAGAHGGELGAAESGWSWDFTRPNPEYFRALERRIADLGALGIEADLILFHAYDRWGFSTLDPDSDDRYVRYLVRRLAAYPNVWWSLANEYDLLWSKPDGHWERIAAVIGANDPFGHLTSIHNCFGFYDHSRPWITHVSAQRIDVYRTAENTDEWREQWGKPVVIDECGYEGDIDQGWGNLTAQELVRRAWEAAVRGGYLAHGETYLNEREQLWWSKGGELVGDSPARLGFLAKVIGEAPGGAIEPLPSEWDVRWGGVGEQYRIAYLGFGQSRFRMVQAPYGRRYHVDLIDTWAMTVNRLPGEFDGVFKVELPGRQYMALRLIAIGDERE